MRHLTGVLNFIVFYFPIKPVTRHESILFTFGLPVLVASALAWAFQFDLHFRSKNLATLTANRKTRSPTKPENKIIDTISHHGNWVILFSMPSSFSVIFFFFFCFLCHNREVVLSPFLFFFFLYCLFFQLSILFHFSFYVFSFIFVFWLIFLFVFVFLYCCCCCCFYIFRVIFVLFPFLCNIRFSVLYSFFFHFVWWVLFFCFFFFPVLFIFFVRVIFIYFLCYLFFLIYFLRYLFFFLFIFRVIFRFLGGRGRDRVSLFYIVFEFFLHFLS